MRVLIASPLHRSAIQRLQHDHDVICTFLQKNTPLEAAIVDREILIVRSGVEIDEDLLRRAPNLKLVIRAGCGFDNIDLLALEKRGIELRRIPQPAAKAVAEMALGLMLALARHIRAADTTMREGRWLKHDLCGHLLSGKTLGIVGAGNIGSRVGELGSAIGMEVIGCVEFPAGVVAERLAKSNIVLSSFEQVISRGDIVSLHVPLKASTRNLINAATLAAMKPGSFLINLARGGVVDETALYDALANGSTIAAAALDVHEQEGNGRISRLASLPNVILTPHIGAMTFETQEKIGQQVINIISEFSQAFTEPRLATFAAAAAAIIPLTPCAESLQEENS